MGPFVDSGLVTSPALACEVLKNQDTIFANRDVPAACKESSYGGKDIVWNPYGPKWRMFIGSTLDSVYALRKRELSNRSITFIIRRDRL